MNWLHEDPQGDDRSPVPDSGSGGDLVEEEPLRLPVRPALLGRGAASADHPGEAAGGARPETGRADPRGRTGNIKATQGDAQVLPYEDASFDAAFLFTTLGEIPDQQAAISEFSRVLKRRGSRPLSGSGSSADGACRNRTGDILLAKQVLCQLS